jgi:arsenate reductase
MIPFVIAAMLAFGSKAGDGSMSDSRTKLFPALERHAESLSATFDRIDAKHRVAGEKLAAWIAANYEPGKPLAVIVVCTGNSRRSIMGSCMGNVAAAYGGMPEIRFFSGGTEPSAFNRRTIAALKDIGFSIEPTGVEAPRGRAGDANPAYRIRWGDAFESTEFSKRYDDPANPKKGFAAIMVCTEADAGCPFVPGAALRLSIPFDDPKDFDESPNEATKYAERRDDIGRLMLFVMAQARQSIDAKARVK